LRDISIGKSRVQDEGRLSLSPRLVPEGGENKHMQRGDSSCGMLAGTEEIANHWHAVFQQVIREISSLPLWIATDLNDMCG
jgi:hypothetical protein